MLSTLSFLVSASGFILLLALLGNLVDKEGKWAAALRNVTLLSAKISGILVALSLMIYTGKDTAGILSFSSIGVYVACLAIIWNSGKDLFAGSKLASDLSIIAAHKASEMQSNIAQKAAQISEQAAQKSNATSTGIAGETGSAQANSGSPTKPPGV